MRALKAVWNTTSPAAAAAAERNSALGLFITLVSKGWLQVELVVSTEISRYCDFFGGRKGQDSLHFYNYRVFALSRKDEHSIDLMSGTVTVKFLQDG